MEPKAEIIVQGDGDAVDIKAAPRAEGDETNVSVFSAETIKAKGEPLNIDGAFIVVARGGTAPLPSAAASPHSADFSLGCLQISKKKKKVSALNNSLICSSAILSVQNYAEGVAERMENE